MLRITVRDDVWPIVLKLEGRVAGPWVDELLRAWNELRVRRPGERVALDLSDVTFVSPEGRMVLEWMAKKGVKLDKARLMTKYVVDQIEDAQSRTL